MFNHYRQRRGPYALATTTPASTSWVRQGIAIVVIGAILFFVGKFILAFFGVGNETERAAAMLYIERGSSVSVSVEGGLMQRVDDNMKIYPGDKVKTAARSHAVLQLFDGTVLRLDESTELMVDESLQGTDSSEWEFTLSSGSSWIHTPDLETFSGAIIRTFHTQSLDLTIPSDTRAVASFDDHVLVFSADGDGVAAVGESASINVGEGQQLVIDGPVRTSYQSFRSALDPLQVHTTFIEESRALKLNPVQQGQIDAPVTGSGMDVLKVTEPADGLTIAAGTVVVRGTFGQNVLRVRVNGYQATADMIAKTFTQEIALQAQGKTTINVEALGQNDVVLEEVQRTVSRGATEVAPPSITKPSGNGSTYRTQKSEIEISGTVPANTTGVYVNDYRLQLFRPNDTTWSYLASTALNNMKAGANTYDVATVDANGNRSVPVRITILVEEGTEGIVSLGSSSTGTATSAAASSVTPDETTLPKNDPLTPGSLLVTAPQAGTSYTATGSEILIEGTTSTATASIWINGYKLQLYKAGKTTWNYIAKSEYGNLKSGTNVYRIVARNEKNEILDTVEYTVTKE